MPEVEWHVRHLAPVIVGRRIRKLHLDDVKAIVAGPPSALAGRVEGRRVRAVTRRAKYICLELDGGETLVVHLGMTGKVVVGEPPKYTRWSLELDRGPRLHLADPRRFSKLFLVKAGEERTHPRLAHLGIDPLSSGFTAAFLHGQLEKTRRSLKVALMDQARFPGIGNIQAIEALWRARLHPLRESRSLTGPEAERLHRGILDSLEATFAGMDEGSITYVEEDPSTNPFLVYGRKDEPCPRCRKPIAYQRIAGRGTYYCPRCQPA